MASKVSSETLYTAQVKLLLNKIHGNGTAHDAIYVQAAKFFEKLADVEQQMIDKEVQLSKIQEELKTTSNKKELVQGRQKLAIAEKALKSYEQEVSAERVIRNQNLANLADEILELSEGEDFAESNRKSAKLLGTIQLLSPTESSQILRVNEQNKALYKAVLCLRLLDRLYLDGNIAMNYITDSASGVTPAQYLTFKANASDDYQRYCNLVKVPLVMSAILQDIGNLHPQAQLILCGEQNNLDPFRTLALEERKALLQINYRETLKYAQWGIGAGKYMGNLKVEQVAFDQHEQQKQVFIRHLLKNWINPKNGVGNLLKVPQLYTSVILATKHNYNYKLLPKVYHVLNQNALRGQCSRTVVESLNKITGTFPQGYGITYIPKDSDGNELDRYEYAIVNDLYPENPEQPICRVVTRNLAFISRGQDIAIPESCNLYFEESAKKIAKMSKKRLNEILELLASNFEERQQADILPRCWHAKDYFSIKDNQNLWNKSGIG